MMSEAWVSLQRSLPEEEKTFFLILHPCFVLRLPIAHCHTPTASWRTLYRSTRSSAGLWGTRKRLLPGIGWMLAVL